STAPNASRQTPVGGRTAAAVDARLIVRPPKPGKCGSRPTDECVAKMDTEPGRNRDRGRNFLPMARPANRPVFSPHRRAAPDLRNADLRARPYGAAGRDGLCRPRADEPVGPRAVAAAALRAPLQP